MKKLLIFIAFLIVALAAISQVKSIPYLSNLIPKQDNQPFFGNNNSDTVKIVSEESVVTKVVENSLPSVVTIGIVRTPSQNQDQFSVDPFNPFFSPFRQLPTPSQKDLESNIGSGFIISKEGIVITNKHVVSDTESTYIVLTNDQKKYNVEKIYRDPLNDLAILKITAKGLKPLTLADTSKLKLGQLTIAIGTPLGEFTNTVTTGIISGLGRGITAGSPFEGSVEKLDNVIQTDAAISPGNSGGPLLNSSGQIIGINTAVAAQGQNIGFAIPADVIKGLMTKFESNGMSFERPYIGVRYKMIDKQAALLNEVVEGAYVIDVLPDSPAEKADIKVEDIIIELDGKKVNGSDDQSITKVILDKKVGDSINLKVWREGEVKSITVQIESSKT